MTRINGKSPQNQAPPDNEMPLIGIPVQVQTQLALVDLDGLGRRIVATFQSANGLQQYYFDSAHARLLAEQLGRLAAAADTGLVLPDSPGLITPS